MRVALVGCGAVARENLLPVLAGHDRIVLGPMVDRDERRARELAEAYGVSSVATDLDQINRDQIDGVVLATPPAHHAPATIASAQRGWHVFVEKPMAIKTVDAQAMVDAADRAGIALSVGLYRRFLPAVQLVRELIERQEFGRLIAVDAEEGGPYGWPLATLDGLKRLSGGGGVLIDLGSHVLDLVFYVLGATPALESYQDNHRGGIETDCVLRASLLIREGSAPLRLELSRTRELRGTVKFECEDATLELVRGNFTQIRILPRRAANATRGIQYSATWQGEVPFIGYEAFRREIDDWIDAIDRKAPPVLSGRSVVPVVALIEQAYESGGVLIEPGDAATVPAPTASPASAGRRKRVLVTGAGGFVGGRAVELLRDQYGWDAVPLVRAPRSAARLARWPHEILLGDICSRADMDRALKGCDAVVHCAVGTSWQPEETRRVTVDGTRIVAEAALAAGVKRFVHISTLFVHRRDGISTVDETIPLEPSPDDPYGQNKLAAERALGEVGRRGLSSIVLRPTRIYGPFSKTFTERPLKALTEGRLVLGGDASVPANMVYVDNVVEAIARALDAHDGLSGSAYLITDPEQVSLRDFYGYFGEPTGASVRLWPDWRQNAQASSTSGFVAQWTSAIATIARSPQLRALVHRIMDTDPIGTLPRKLWDVSPSAQRWLLRRFGADSAVIYRRVVTDSVEDLVYYGEPALVVGEKAQRELKFNPSVSHVEAMARTLRWAQYARLLPVVALGATSSSTAEMAHPVP